MNLVSIIVPCYKQAHFLNESLQSVLEQTYAHWECIIVNDGSPDATELVATEWCKKDSRFKYLYKENGGLPSARNFGIRSSLGVYILPLDSDDVLHKDYLTRLVPVLNEDASLGIVSCYRYFFTGSTSNIINEYKSVGNTYHYLLFENMLMPSSLFRKQCWEQVNGYDETMTKGYEDWEFWLSITKLGWQYKIIEEFLFYYRKSKNSMLVDTTNNHSESVRKYIFIKHKELYIENFENCMEVLYFHINMHRTSKMKLKNSLEYKIGKFITKPFRFLFQLIKLKK